MGGKVWSKLEEEIFWVDVAKRAPPGLHKESKAVKQSHKDLKKSWKPLVDAMVKAMTERDPEKGLPRTYTEVSMYEHYFQNFVQGKLSPNAGPFVQSYKDWLKEKAENPEADSVAIDSGASRSSQSVASDAKLSVSSASKESRPSDSASSFHQGSRGPIQDPVGEFFHAFDVQEGLEDERPASSIPMNATSQQSANPQAPVSRAKNPQPLRGQVTMPSVPVPQPMLHQGGPTQSSMPPPPGWVPDGVLFQMDGFPQQAGPLYPGTGFHQGPWGPGEVSVEEFLKYYPKYWNMISNGRDQMVAVGHDPNTSVPTGIPNQNHGYPTQNTSGGSPFHEPDPAQIGLPMHQIIVQQSTSGGFQHPPGLPVPMGYQNFDGAQGRQNTSGVGHFSTGHPALTGFNPNGMHPGSYNNARFHAPQLASGGGQFYPSSDTMQGPMDHLAQGNMGAAGPGPVPSTGHHFPLKRKRSES